MSLSASLRIITALVAMPVPAWAKHHAVPEISATGSLTAVLAVAIVALIVWERRRHTIGQEQPE